MVWIELHQSLIKHKKTLKAARRLGISKAAMIGHLATLWCWALDNSPTGSLCDCDPDVIADACEYDGDPGHLLAVLIEVGFIDNQDGSLFLHDWHDYAGKLVASRIKNAERMRKARAEQHAEFVQECAENVQSTCGACAGATVPYRTVPNQYMYNDGCTSGGDDLTLSLPDETPAEKYSPEFETWWDIYPRKIGKGRSYKLWLTWKKRVGVLALLRAAGQYAAEVRGRDQEKIKHPSTFLAADNTLVEEYAANKHTAPAAATTSDEETFWTEEALAEADAYYAEVTR